MNLLLAALTLTVASFIAVCIYPPALAWAVNLVFYLLLEYNQKLGVKKMTVKSIDLWNWSLKGLEVEKFTGETLVVNTFAISGRSLSSLFSGLDRKRPFFVQIKGCYVKGLVQKSSRSRTASAAASQKTKTGPSILLSKVLANVCLEIEDVQVFAFRDNDDTRFIRLSLKSCCWTQIDTVSGICTNALSSKELQVSTHDLSVVPLILPQCDVQISFVPTASGFVGLERVSIIIPRAVALACSPEMFDILSPVDKEPCAMESDGIAAKDAVTDRPKNDSAVSTPKQVSLDIKEVELMLVGRRAEKRARQRLLHISFGCKLQISSLQVSSLESLMDYRLMELIVPTFKLETASSLELCVLNISVNFKYEKMDKQTSTLHIHVDEVDFKDVKQFSNSKLYSNIFLKNIDAHGELVGVHLDTRCKLAVSTVETSIIIFPAIFESLSKDYALLKDHFLLKLTRADADVDKRSPFPSKSVEPGSFVGMSVDICSIEVQYFVSSVAGFCCKIPKLSMNTFTDENRRDKIGFSVLKNVELSVFHEENEWSLGCLRHFSGEFVTTHVHEPSGHTGSLTVIDILAVDIYIGNTVPLGEIINMFLLQLKGIFVRVLPLIRGYSSDLDKDGLPITPYSQNGPGKVVELTVHTLAARFEDEIFRLKNEFEDDRDRINPKTQKRFDLFNLIASGVTMKLSTHNYSRKTALKKMASWDSCTKPPLGYGFVDIYGGDLSVAVSMLNIKLRNFYHDLFKANRLELNGGVVLACLNRTKWCTWRKKIILAGDTERKPVPILLASTPMKVYYNLIGSMDYGSAAWGPNLNFALGAWSRTIGRLLPKSVDSSKPLKYWDQFRYMIHGPIKLSCHNFDYIAYGPGTNSHTDDYCLLNLKELSVYLHKQGLLECSSALGTISRNSVFAETIGHHLVEMKDVTFCIAYVWYAPDCDGFDHYVQLHEDRVAILRKGKQIRDVFAAFRAYGLDLNMSLEASATTAILEWHRYLRWYIDVYYLFVAAPEIFWTVPPMTEPSIGFILSKYVFDMNLGNIYLVIDDSSVGEFQDTIVTSKTLSVYYGSNYKASSFEPGVMDKCIVDLSKTALYVTSHGVRKIELINDLPIFSSKSLRWTLDEKMEDPNSTVIDQGKLRWTVDGRDCVVDLLGLLWESPGSVTEDTAGNTQNQADNEGQHEAYTVTQMRLDSGDSDSATSVEEEGDCHENKMESVASSRKMRTKRESTQQDLDPEVDEMSLLDLLVKRNKTVDARRSSVESNRSSNEESFKVHPASRRRTSSSTSPLARHRPGSNKWWDETDFVTTYKVLLVDLQVYFLSVVTHSGMLVASPEVTITGRHKEENMAGMEDTEEIKDRMDELYIETSSVELYVAPGDVEISKDPWLDGAVATPRPAGLSNSGGFGTSNEQNEVAMAETFALDGLLLPSVSAGDDVIYRLALTTPGLQIAQQSFSNYAPHTRLRIKTVKATTNSQEFYQILDVVQTVLLAPPKQKRKNDTVQENGIGINISKTEESESEVSVSEQGSSSEISDESIKKGKKKRGVRGGIKKGIEQKKASKVAGVVAELERILEKRNREDNDSVVSVLSYDFDGLEWTLQSMNDGSPIDLGIIGLHGVHTFNEDTSTSVDIDLANLFLVDMKPSGEAMQYFEDSTMVVRPVLLDRKQTSENFLEIRTRTAPTVHVRGTNINVYEQLEVRIFPGAQYVVCIQLTDRVAQGLSDFFYGEEDIDLKSNVAGHEESGDGFDEEVFLLGALAKQKKISKREESPSTTTMELVNTEEVTEKKEDQISLVFFERARVGEINIMVSIRGFQGWAGLAIQADKFPLTVSPSDENSLLISWKDYLKKLQHHAATALLHSYINGNNRVRAETLKTDVEENQSALLLGGKGNKH